MNEIEHFQKKWSRKNGGGDILSPQIQVDGATISRTQNGPPGGRALSTTATQFLKLL